MKWKTYSIHLLLALATGSMVALSYSYGLFSDLEARLEDNFYSTHTPDTRLVVLAIDDDSLSRIGQWPWPRSVYAKVLASLDKASPRALGIDVLLSEPSRLGAYDDDVLKRSLESLHFPVVLGAEAEHMLLQEKSVTSPSLVSPLQQFITPHTSVGLVNVISDKDGVVRSFPYSATINNTSYLTLGAKVLTEAKLLSTPPHAQGVTRLVYDASPNTIRTVPLYRMLESDAPILKDSIVFIGATAPSLRDNEKTPLQSDTPGVYIHTLIAHMLLKNVSLTPLAKSVTVVLLFLVALISALFFIIAKNITTAVLLNVIFGGLCLIVTILCFERGIVINFTHMTFAWVLTTITLSLFVSLRNEREKKFITQTFSKYVSKEVLDTLLADPKKVTLGGEEREITILFSDIRGFTTLSEGLTPTSLVALLNRYFETVTPHIIDNGGVLDKYIGDAIMAFWGAPIPDQNQADKAVRAGLQILTALEKLNTQLKSEGIPEIAIGIGIYSGKAVVGNVGSSFRFDYTAIGDTVNAASRLEGLTKDYKAKLIIGESTKVLLKETKNLIITPLGNASVKGKKESITIYKVEGK